MATRKTTKSTRPAPRTTKQRSSKKPGKLREHVAKLSPSSIWSYAKYDKKLTALFILLFVCVGIYIIYRSMAGVGHLTTSQFNWSGTPVAGHSSIENDLVIDSAPLNEPLYWASQYYFQTPSGQSPSGVAYMGLQTTGSRVDGSNGKTAVFSVFGAAIQATAGACSVEQGTNFDGYQGLSGTSCRVPYDWSAGTSYRFKIVRGATEGQNTWWIGTVNGREIGSIKVASSWGGMKGVSLMWTEYFGNQPAECKGYPYARARFSNPIADGRMINAQPGSSLKCSNAKVAITPSGITQEVGIPPLPPPPNVKDCKSDGTCPRCSIAVTGNSRGTWTATWSSSNLGTAKYGWGATLKNSATGTAATTGLPVNGSRVVSPLAGVYNTYTLNIYDGWAISNVSCTITVRPGGATTPPPPAPPPPPAAAYCKISVAKNSSGTWIGSWSTYNLGAAQYGWDATLTNSATGNTTNNVGINSTRTLAPRVGYNNTYTLRIYDGWAVTSTQCSTTIKG